MKSNKYVELLANCVWFVPLLDVMERGTLKRAGLLVRAESDFAAQEVEITKQDTLTQANWVAWLKEQLARGKWEFSPFELKCDTDVNKLLQPGTNDIPTVDWVATPLVVIKALGRHIPLHFGVTAREEISRLKQEIVALKEGSTNDTQPPEPPTDAAGEVEVEPLNADEASPSSGPPPPEEDEKANEVTPKPTKAKKAKAK